MKKLRNSRLGAALLALLLSAGLAAAAAIPATVVSLSGVKLYSNAKASIDASNLSEGYLSARYTGGRDTRIKLQITREGGTTYTYDLNRSGVAETFPLTEGDGTYSVKLYENSSGSKYAQAYSCTLELKLRSEYAPFLYPNQYVNFTPDCETAKKAAALMQGKTKDLDKVTAVFDYVVDHFSYDSELAKTVKSGYLPQVDRVLKAEKGICFDYAAVMAAMLRSQGIPCKLVVGYAGETYHAWINVYVAGEGWVDNAIYFDGVNWTLMDPTFTSSGKRGDDIMEYVTNQKNYSQKYAY